jgi:hypothetical protein
LGFYFVDKTLPEKVPLIIIAVCLISVLEYLIEDSPDKCQEPQTTKTFIQCQDPQATKTHTSLPQCQDPLTWLIGSLGDWVEMDNLLEWLISNNQANNAQTLIEFLKKIDTVEFLGNLPAILLLQKQLVEKYTGRIALSDVEEMSIRDFYHKVDDTYKEQFIQLSEVLLQTWNSLADKVRSFGGIMAAELAKLNMFDHVLDPGNTPASFLFPASHGTGLCSYALAMLLIDTHNSLVRSDLPSQKFLPSLLKNCKECIHISCYETTKLVLYFQEDIYHLLASKHEKLFFGSFQDLWQLFYLKLSQSSISVYQSKQALLYLWYSATVDCPKNIKLFLTNPHVVKTTPFNHISPCRASCLLPSAFCPQCPRRSSISGSRPLCSDQCSSYHRLAIFKQAFECDTCKKAVQTSVFLEAQISQQGYIFVIFCVHRHIWNMCCNPLPCSMPLMNQQTCSYFPLTIYCLSKGRPVYKACVIPIFSPSLNLVSLFNWNSPLQKKKK